MNSCFSEFVLQKLEEYRSENNSLFSNFGGGKAVVQSLYDERLLLDDYLTKIDSYRKELT